MCWPCFTSMGCGRRSSLERSDGFSSGVFLGFCFFARRLTVDLTAVRSVDLMAFCMV